MSRPRWLRAVSVVFMFPYLFSSVLFLVSNLFLFHSFSPFVVICLKSVLCIGPTPLKHTQRHSWPHNGPMACKIKLQSFRTSCWVSSIYNNNSHNHKHTHRAINAIHKAMKDTQPERVYTLGRTLLQITCSVCTASRWGRSNVAWDGETARLLDLVSDLAVLFLWKLCVLH